MKRNKQIFRHLFSIQDGIDMNYNKYQHKELSEIGMGCYTLGGAYGQVNGRRYKEVLKHAYDQGVNLFDTADTYGPKAEEVLGEAVAPFREEINISTKVGIREGYKADMSYDSVISACDDSLERLDTSYVDFYFVHFDDPDTPVERTIGALEDLKMDGKIDNYGLSHLPIDRVKEYVEKGDVTVSMLELSAVSRQAKKELLPFYNENDIGAFAFSITGRGILTGKFEEKPQFEPGDIRNMDPLFKHARFESALRIAEKMDKIGDKYDKSSVQVAINWVINQDGIISALTGPSTIEHLEENVGGSGWDIHEEDMEELDKFLEEEEERLKKTEPERVKKILTQGLPDHKGTAFNDLVYAMETSINHDMVKEKEIMPLFQKLITMQKSEKGLTEKGLKEIQTQIRNTVF